MAALVLVSAVGTVLAGWWLRPRGGRDRCAGPGVRCCGSAAGSRRARWPASRSCGRSCSACCRCRCRAVGSRWSLLLVGLLDPAGVFVAVALARSGARDPAGAGPGRDRGVRRRVPRPGAGSVLSTVAAGSSVRARAAGTTSDTIVAPSRSACWPSPAPCSPPWSRRCGDGSVPWLATRCGCCRLAGGRCRRGGGAGRLARGRPGWLGLAAATAPGGVLAGRAEPADGRRAARPARRGPRTRRRAGAAPTPAGR